MQITGVSFAADDPVAFADNNGISYSYRSFPWVNEETRLNAVMFKGPSSLSGVRPRSSVSHMNIHVLGVRKQVGFAHEEAANQRRSCYCEHRKYCISPASNYMVIAVVLGYPQLMY
jgi:hypothetical protein